MFGCQVRCFHSLVSLLPITGKQGLKDGTAFLPLHSVLGKPEDSVSYELSGIQDHNSTSFYRTPLIQAQPYSWADKVPIIVRNRLNFLSINEEHRLLEIPNTERDEWTNGVDTGRFTLPLKASFPVYGVVSCAIMQIKPSSCNVDSFINGCLGEQITP